MFSYDNLKEAIIHGLIAVRAVVCASSLKYEELNLAARNIKRQARIAAHHAIAHLGQGGQAPQPMSQEAKENVIRMVRARVGRAPRALKSLPGGATYSLFHARGQRSTETTSTETTKRRA